MNEPMPVLSHVDEQGAARMVDVGGKPLSDRRAVATARVRIGDALADAIANNSIAKGSLLDVARLAGIQAAKRTADLIPLCHSLPLDGVQVDLRLDRPFIHIRAEARTTWKTGVEMEALTAAAVAALTVIDMGKAIDKGMVIEEVRLLEKTGGQGGAYRAAVAVAAPPEAAPARMQSPPLRIAVLTISDRCSRGQAEDASGPALADLARRRLVAEVIATACVPDEPDQIRAQLLAWANQPAAPDVILTTGGTGLSPRDVTPEATAAVLDRRCPGLLELARQRCSANTPRAFLSRGEAGVCGRTLIVNLPGSPRGATETLSALCDVLPHTVHMIHGERGDHAR